MKIYFSPLACSLASRIVAYEAGAQIDFIEVDPKTKRTEDNADFYSVNPLGLVPTLVTDDGAVLTENAAVLQALGDLYPAASLVPDDRQGRSRVHQWLSFIGTELHKGVYVTLLSAVAPEGAKSLALSKVESRLGWVDKQLEGREFALEKFSVVDAYLIAVLNWSAVTPVDLAPFSAITSYLTGVRKRPSVRRAMAEEQKLYARERDRHAANAEESPAQAIADRYIGVWNETNEEARREMIRGLWAQHGSHFARTLEVRGWDALEERVKTSHERNVRDRDFRFRANSGAERLRDAVHFTWEMHPATAPTQVEARGSALLLTVSGRIVVDYLFFEAN